MKKTINGLLALVVSTVAIAQPKDFEGVIRYKVDVKSKTAGVSDRVCRTMLMLGDSMVAFVKPGLGKQVTGPAEIYSVAKKERIYLKFKGIDTLFYIDYASDTSTVQSVMKPDERKMIAGYDCRLITIRSGASVKKYYYAPSLYANPVYDEKNKIGNYDVFARETSSIYLGFNEENDAYSLTETCTRLQQQPVDDAVFTLPDLPLKAFTPESIVTAPALRGSLGWEKYLQANLNNSLAAKYLKIPKKESGAMQTATVVFMINDKGRVENAQVLNKSEVHPRLAEEALRVVNASPAWTPALMFGEKVIYWYRQLITFSVTK